MWPLANKYRLGIYLTPTNLHCALVTYQQTKKIIQNTHLCFSTEDSTQLKQQVSHMQQQYAQHCRHCHGMISCQSAHLQVMTIDKPLSSAAVKHYINHNSQSLFNHPLCDLLFDYQPMANNNTQQQWLLVACKKTALHAPTSLRSLQVDAMSCSQLIQNKISTKQRYVLAYCDQQAMTCYVSHHNRMLSFCRKDLLDNPQLTAQAITHLATSDHTQDKTPQPTTSPTTIYLTGTNSHFLTRLQNQLTQSTPLTTYNLVEQFKQPLLLQPSSPAADNSNTDISCHLYATLAALYGDSCR